jgi:hypothetical protein
VGAWGTKSQTWPGTPEESLKSIDGKRSLIKLSVVKTHPHPDPNWIISRDRITGHKFNKRL